MLKVGTADGLKPVGNGVRRISAINYVDEISPFPIDTPIELHNIRSVYCMGKKIVIEHDTEPL